MHILSKFERGNYLGGGFYTHRWRSSTSPKYNPGISYWIVNSRLKKHKFIRFLQMRVLFEETSEVEQRCLYDAPGVLNDNLFISALRAKITGVNLNILSIRLNSLSLLTGLPRLDLPLLRTWEKICVYSIQEFSRAIRKPKKYSGYVRSPSSVGSRRTTKRTLPDPEIVEWSSVKEIDFLSALTVGEFHGESLVIHLPDEEPNRFETVKHKNLK